MQPETAVEARAWFQKATNDLRGAGIHEARDLTVFAWEFRYPGDSQVPSQEEAVQILALARQVVTALLDRLPVAIRP